MESFSQRTLSTASCLMRPPLNRDWMTQHWVHTGGLWPSESTQFVIEDSNYPSALFISKLVALRPNLQVSPKTTQILKKSINDIINQLMSQAVLQAKRNAAKNSQTLTVYAGDVITTFVNFLDQRSLSIDPAKHKFDKVSVEWRHFSRHLEKLAQTLHPNVTFAFTAMTALNSAVQDLTRLSHATSL
jgi:hypothetical protein